MNGFIIHFHFHFIVAFLFGFYFVRSCKAAVYASVFVRASYYSTKYCILRKSSKQHGFVFRLLLKQIRYFSWRLYWKLWMWYLLFSTENLHYIGKELKLFGYVDDNKMNLHKHLECSFLMTLRNIIVWTKRFHCR